MANIPLKREAIKMRLSGMTYTDIKKKVGVSKSTLSYWLGNYPLSKIQLRKLSENISNKKAVAIEKISRTKRIKRENIRKQVYLNESSHLLPINNKELYIAGLMLYWGEGTKGWGSTVSLCNTDPRVLKFYLKWLVRCLRVPKSKIKVSLQLYKNMDIDKTVRYWIDELKISRAQFIKPYIKKSETTSVDHRGYSYGTCGLYVYDSKLKTKIISAINVLSDKSFELN